MATRSSPPPPGFRQLATTRNTPVAAMAAPERRLYAVQFHPEVAHTPQGQRVLENFLFQVAGLKPGWSMSSFVDHAVESVRASGRAGARAVRALGRRGLGGDGGARPPGDRRPAPVRLRRQRAPPERGRGGRAADLPGPLRDAAPLRGRRQALPGPPPRRDRSRGEAEADRRRVHRRVPGGGRAPGNDPVPGPGHPLSGRDRVHLLPRPVGDDQDPPQRRAGCRRTSASRWWSRCGSSSRTRCACSASFSACRRRSSGASRSPARGSPCASWAR